MRLLNSNTNLENFTKIDINLSLPIKVIFNLQNKLDIPLRNKLERGNKKFLLLYFPVMLELCRLSHILHWYYCFCIIHPPHRCVLSILRTLEIYCNHLGWMILLDFAVWNIICLSYDITAILDVLTTYHWSKNIRI